MGNNKSIWKPFFELTPKNVIILGHSLQAASITAGGFAILSNYKYLGMAIIVAGFVGKFLSEFLSTNRNKSDKSSV